MPKLYKLHKNLQLAMKKYDILQSDIEQLLGKRHTYVSERMTGKRPWDLDDIYAIRAYINSQAYDDEPEVIPLSQLSEFFPPRNQPGIKKGA